VADSTIGVRQVGRRAMVVCGALIVAPDSSIYTPQDLDHRVVALDYGNGTAYAGLQMLESAMPREAVKTRSFDANPAKRFAALMAGEFDATVVQEPWITVAEKAGCRLVSTTFFYGTWVADDTVDAETYGAFVRATTAAARRINADKRNYVRYFKTHDFQPTPEVQALSIDDFNLSRIQVKAPEPIPEADARWDWDWMSSWGVLSGEYNLESQINVAVQTAAHASS
jgi:ABC-type nitrate/sulfonate/bicarbonate transport system substrate-binding protein